MIEQTSEAPPASEAPGEAPAPLNAVAVPKPAPQTQLTGMQKAALVIMQLDRVHAGEVMRQFTESEAEEIAAEIVSLRRVDAGTAEAALAEFHERTLGGDIRTRGGRDVAAGLLAESFGSEKAAGLMDRLASTLAGRPFEFLDTAEAGQVSTLLDGELPETVALVLAHLTPVHASHVLARLDPEQRADVAQCIATMGSATPEAVAVVAETLRVRAKAVVVPNEPLEVVGGVQPLVDIVTRADSATERALLDALDERDPELAEEVRSRMLSFADLAGFGARDVQQVLRGIEIPVLAVAMKGAASELIALIGQNMSERNRELLDDERAMLGPVRKSQIDEARAEVVRAIRELEAQGSITVHRAEEDELVD